MTREVTSAATSFEHGPAADSTHPERPRIAYQPALDGIRALAVLAVLLFHAEVPGFSGGYLGVSVFFTLSGFLITSLLAAETASSGRVSLPAFYARRARRLLPAAVLLVVLVVLASALTDLFDGVADLRAHAVGSLLQVSNWVFLASDGSYQELLQRAAGTASPLEHFWSLSIEEQFYWLWPVAFVAIWRAGRDPRGRLRLLAGVTLAFALAAPLTANAWGPDAAYWASPARAAEILLGALAAALLIGRSLPRWMWLLAPASMLVLGTCIVLFPAAGGPAYSGWLPAIGLASAALLVGLQIDSPVRRVCSTTALVALGRISYGVYLYHWPIFVVLNEERVGVGGPALVIVRFVATMVAAVLSYFVVEQPIRSMHRMPARSTLMVGGGATAVALALALVLVPAGSGRYWAASDEVVRSAALDEETAPLVALPPTTLAAAPDPTAPDPTAPDPGPAVAPTTTPAGPATSQASSTASSAPTTSSTVPPIPALSRPVRIVVAGDSTAEALGAGIVGWAAANDEVAQAELDFQRGCGFLRGGQYRVDGEWFDVDDRCDAWLSDGLVAEIGDLTPDVVMLVTTSWDVLDRRWDDGPGQDTAELRDRITAGFAELTDEVLASGAGSVAWVKAPIPNPLWFSRGTAQEQPARHDVLHDVMDQLAAERPGEVYTIDLRGWFDAVGLTEDVDTRPDGVHVTVESATLIAEEYLGEQLLRAALDLEPRELPDRATSGDVGSRVP